MNLTLGLTQMQRCHPERVVTWYRERRRTYGEMAGRVARIASVLKARGVQAGDRVAMLAVNSDYYLEFYLATWWAGAIATPVNTRWSAAEIIYSLNDSGASVLLIDLDFLHLLPEIQSQSHTLEQTLFFGDGAAPTELPNLEQLLADAAPIQDALRQRDDPAVIFYTGGTTGFPKGVILSHFNLWSSAMSRMAMIHSSPEAVGLHAAPLFHVAAAGRMIAHTLIGGSAVILPAFRPEDLIDCIERHAIAEVVLIPSMLQMLLALALIIGLLFAGAVLLRRLNGGKAFGVFSVGGAHQVAGDKKAGLARRHQFLAQLGRCVYAEGGAVQVGVFKGFVLGAHGRDGTWVGAGCR